MKKLALDNPAKLTADVTLEVRVAQCSFCGEGNKKCVKELKPTSVTYIEYETDYGEVIKDWKFEKQLFGPTIKVILGGHPKYEKIVKSWRYKEKESYSDICVDCIEQLGKLVK